MTTYRQDPETREFIELPEYYRRYPPKARSRMQIIGDIDPYQSMINGEVISGRAEHKAHLRENGCVEVGNTPTDQLKKIRPDTDPSGVEHDVAEVYNVIESS